jgi:hypothetical protein
MAKEISLLLSFQIGTGAHRAFFAIRPLDKWAGFEADHDLVFIVMRNVGVVVQNFLYMFMLYVGEYVL